jgi:cytochrome c-type biogenesis protein CcmE
MENQQSKKGGERSEDVVTHVKTKMSVAGAVLVCAIGYLGFAGVQKGWVYQMEVDQYLASANEQGMRVRLVGTAAEEGLEVKKAQLTATFMLKGEKSQVPVRYKGVIPDMFKAGGEVVVEGKKDAAGVFQADVLMTKCASKYEEKPAGHPVDGNAKDETQNTKGKLGRVGGSPMGVRS